MIVAGCGRVGMSGDDNSELARFRGREAGDGFLALVDG